MGKVKKPSPETTIDRRASGDRRGGDRRVQNIPVAVERRKIERRVKVSRRRQIDPTTCERDYTPAEVQNQKVKKSAAPMSLTLTPTVDFSVILGRQKKSGQILIGFAAETENLIEGARRKLERKNLDWIVANDVTQTGAGFDVDTNIVTFISRDQLVSLPIMSKRDVANHILDLIPIEPAG